MEYFTLDEAQYAIAQIKQNPIKIRNNPIYVTYSKIRKSDEARDLIESFKPNSTYENNNVIQKEFFLIFSDRFFLSIGE